MSQVETSDKPEVCSAIQDNVASLVNVKGENSEVWLNGATLEMDGGVGRGLTQAAQATSVHVLGTSTFCS